jgi:hypothetical protein
MGSGNELQLVNICWKKCWVWEESLAVYPWGELMFKQQLLMIFIV